MRKLLTLVLVLLSAAGYSQVGQLPENIKTAFQEKYSDIKIGDWWLDNEMYYIDFTLLGGSYTSVYDQNGTWKETSQIISDMDIPVSLTDYIHKRFPAGKISYCEEVETTGMNKFLRLYLIDTGNVTQIIKSDLDGKNTEILDANL